MASPLLGQNFTYPPAAAIKNMITVTNSAIIVFVREIHLPIYPWTDGAHAVLGQLPFTIIRIKEFVSQKNYQV